MIITKNDYKQLKKLYNLAVKENKEFFLFKDKEILTAYAKYLIEYLSTSITTYYEKH